MQSPSEKSVAMKTRKLGLFSAKAALCSSLLSTLMLVGTIQTTQAAEVPGLDRDVVINAREQPIDLFLNELFGQLGVPARVSENIIGTVNGDFRKSAGDVFYDISSSFQLSVYYDGAVAHVYPANEIVHNVLYMPSSTAKAVERAARKLDLIDQRNTMSVADVGLVVTGAQRFVEQVERLADAMRKTRKNNVAAAPETHDTYRTFQLRYAWADDVSLVIGGETVIVPGVASLMRSLIEPGALEQAPVSTVRIPDSPSMDGLRGEGLQAVTSQAEKPENQAKTRQQAVAGAADDGSTAKTRIVADPLSNSVIIRDRADRMQGYEELIQSLDKEPQMIEIEATIIDLDTNKLRELGVNWRFQADNSEALLGDGSIADQLLRPNTDVTPSGNGGIISLVLGSQQEFIARIKALETQGAARIVSKPHVMTLSNVEALLDTTSTFFVRVEGQEEVDLFDVSVGTTLRVTPHVYERGGRSQIKLRVNIEDGSTSDQLVDQIPVVENSTIATQAIIDMGQSLLIGGLVREVKNNGISRVPVLGSIPIVGGLFRTQIKASTRRERIFLITPRVTSSGVAGKRFSAPILEGSENDIIQSSPRRLHSARTALDKLDGSYPLEQPLPRGDGLTSDNAAPHQFKPTTSPDTNSEPVIEPSGPRTLRDRLLVRSEDAAAQPDSVLPPSPAEQQVQEGTLTATEPSRPSTTDEWQAVFSAPQVTTQATAHPTAAKPVETGNSDADAPWVAVDDDGWQDISQ
jgi:type III secretion protein C